MSAFTSEPLASGTGIRWQDYGTSEDAQTIRTRLARSVGHILTSAFSGRDFHAGIESLIALEEEAGEPNWDSKGAAPVKPAALSAGRRFLALMPIAFPEPYIAADPDGDVSFEWKGRSGWLFSISLGADQSIAYAGIFGPARVKGIEYFGDEIPSAITNGLRRALGGR